MVGNNNHRLGRWWLAGGVRRDPDGCVPDSCELAPIDRHKDSLFWLIRRNIAIREGYLEPGNIARQSVGK